jgi:hypothetical protein
MHCDALAQDRDQWLALVNMVMNICAPWNAVQFSSSLVTVSLLKRRTQVHGVREQRHKTCPLHGVP